MHGFVMFIWYSAQPSEWLASHLMRGRCCSFLKPARITSDKKLSNYSVELN